MWKIPSGLWTCALLFFGSEQTMWILWILFNWLSVSIQNSKFFIEFYWHEGSEIYGSLSDW